MTPLEGGGLKPIMDSGSTMPPVQRRKAVETSNAFTRYDYPKDKPMWEEALDWKFRTGQVNTLPAGRTNPGLSDIFGPQNKPVTNAPNPHESPDAHPQLGDYWKKWQNWQRFIKKGPVG